MPKTKKPHATKTEINKVLAQYEGWSLNSNSTVLTKTFNFKNFVNGLVFVARIAVHAEVLGHHPDIELSYGKVKVKLTTHELKLLSKLDLALLQRIESIKSEGE